MAKVMYTFSTFDKLVMDPQKFDTSSAYDNCIRAECVSGNVPGLFPPPDIVDVLNRRLRC